MNWSTLERLEMRREYYITLIKWYSKRPNEYDSGVAETLKDELDWINGVIDNEKAAHDGAAV